MYRDAPDYLLLLRFLITHLHYNCMIFTEFWAFQFAAGEFGLDQEE